MKKSLKCISAFIALFLFAAAAFAVTQEEARREIFANADSFAAKRCADVDYFEVSGSGKPVGYCLNVVARGYGGPIHMLVGIDREGIIMGVRILTHSETPGIGARINEVLPGDNRPWFLEQFVGKSGRTVALKKDVDAVTGATISSNAVTSAINSSVNEFLSKMKRESSRR